MKAIAAVFTALALGLTAAAYAQHGSHGGAQAGTVHQASGKVTKVDRASGRVTIAHGPVASLKWPPMTMAFQVKDKALLEKAKVGEKVEFSFVQSEGRHVITEIR